MNAGLLGAMRAAEKRSSTLQTVTDDTAFAVRTARGEGVDRALEAVEGMTRAVHRYFERFVVLVAAVLTLAHSPPIPVKSNRKCAEPVPVNH